MNASGRALGLSIGQLAKATGSKVQTIRYYEQLGLMPAPERSQGNQRIYGARHERRLAFIRHGRELGFPLDAIRQLLSLADQPDRPCAEADAIAQEQLAAVRSKIARLRALEDELERMVACCASGTIGDCHVIEVLADLSHQHCLTPDHRGQDSEFGDA
ncbi:MAG: helix-turn-helix domain-containing protein [Alphaproteobacteria bacterium]|jgi:DNA-binding transcriptional MerR regulator|nr:helix-turn-helix domain-containing protein [Alphaproteobacteria bacterium]